MHRVLSSAWRPAKISLSDLVEQETDNHDHPKSHDAKLHSDTKISHSLYIMA